MTPPGSRFDTFAARVFLLGAGTLVGLVLAETVLRIWPLHIFTVRGNDISLPANLSIEIDNPRIAGTDRVIRYSRNAIGFRGPPPPADLASVLSIVTVGGSTTECLLLSDDHTWPSLLQDELRAAFPQVWINNAGFDGHSTRGHELLMSKYIAPMAPDVVLFLAGINDRNGPGNAIDRWMQEDARGGSYVFNAVHRWRGWDHGFVAWLAEKSELASSVLNVVRFRRANELGLTHSQLDLSRARIREVSEESIQQRLSASEPAAAAFEQAMNRLVDSALEAGILPVLMTQSLLYGDAIDDQTGFDLARIELHGGNGLTTWRVLELFNDATRRVARTRDVPLIDLARQLPKSSRYYYDGVHYSKQGAAKVAEVVAAELCPILRDRLSPSPTRTVECP